MIRYLGIVKKETENMTGVDVEIMARTSRNKREVESWIKNYNDYKKIIIEYDEKQAIDIESFFEEFEDLTSLAEDEKKNAEIIYKKLMSEEE